MNNYEVLVRILKRWHVRLVSLILFNTEMVIDFKLDIIVVS